MKEKQSQTPSKENSAKRTEVRCIECDRLLFIFEAQGITAGGLQIEIKCRCSVFNKITCGQLQK